MTTLPTTMKGVLLTGHGGPEMLEYRQDIPVPAPKENEVLIRVSAAGVNNTDINTRIGWYSKVTTTAKTQVGAAMHWFFLAFKALTSVADRCCWQYGG